MSIWAITMGTISPKRNNSLDRRSKGTMPRILLILTILVSFCSKAQHATDSIVMPFQDYAACKTGFINQLGDTIWSAIFAETAMDPNGNSFWYVKNNEKWGVLDSKGKMILEPTLDDLRYHSSEVILAEQQHKIGILDLDYQWIFHPQFDSIIHSMDLHWGDDGHFDVYIFRKEWKFGVFTSSFEQVIPPIYDSIGAWQSRTNFESLVDSIFFQVKKNGRIGLINFEGQKVLDAQYSSISPLKVNRATEALKFWFHVADSSGNELLKDDRANELIPASDKIFFSKTSEFFDDRMCYPNKEIFNAYVQIGDSGHVVNLRTFHKSRKYTALMQFDTHHFFRDHRGWGVLDENFEEIFSGGKDLPNARNDILRSWKWEKDGFHLSYTGYQHYLPGNGQVLCSQNGFVLQCTLNRKTATEYYGESSSQTVVNFRTGQSLGTSYDKIFLKERQGQFYIWGVNDHSDYFEIEVYNSAMEKVISRKDYRDLYRYNHNRLDYLFSEVGAIVIQDSMGCFGQIRNDGFLSHETQYDRLHPIRFSRKVDESSHLVSQAVKDSVFYILSDDGSVLIQGDKRIHELHEGWYAPGVVNGRLYDSKFRLIFDKVNDRGRIHDKNAPEELLNDRPRTYYVNGGKIYLQQGDGFVLLNKKVLNFEEDCRIINKSLLLHKSGRMIFSDDSWNYPQVNKTKDGYLGYSYDRIVLFDRKGKIVRETRGFNKYRLEGWILTLKYEDGSLEVIDVRTGKTNIGKEWGVVEVKPFYASNEANSIVYTCKDTLGKWHVMNGENRKACKFTFDERCSRFGPNMFLGKVGEKYALFDWKGNLKTPFEIQNATQFDGNFAYQLNEKWHILPRDSINQKYFLTPVDFMYTNRFNTYYVMQTGDSISFFDERLNLLHSPQSIPDMLSDSLRFDRPLRRNYGDLNTSHDFVKVYNRILWKDIRLNQMKGVNDFFNAEKEKLKSVDSLGVMRLFEYRIIGHAFDRLYTTRLMGVGYDERLNQQLHEELRHFEWKEDELIPIQIEDLFKDVRTYHEVMDSLFTKEIEVNQLYGISCTNLPEILEVFKENCFFSKEGISSNDGAYRRAVVKWEDILSYLKPAYQEFIAQGQL